MQPFLEMAKDLGLQKIAALYDKDTNGCFENDKISYPAFLLRELPTVDIRDKPESGNKPKKQGVFDEKGNIKEEFKDKFRKIMGEFISFLEDKGFE